MGWTINNKTPAELGVTVAGWSEESLNASELLLDTVVEDYATNPPSELAYNTPVIVKLDGQQLYKGKVRSTPRLADGETEGMSYSILDAYDELDRVVYHDERHYATNVSYTDDSSVVTTVARNVGAVLFDDDVPLGDRIKKVLEYAISVGVDLQVGEIYRGIDWVRTEYKDLTCGEIIREIMRLMSECVFWIDNKTNPPTANMKLRRSMTALSFDINSGDVMINNDIVELESERVRGVVLKYEIPVSVDGQNYTFLIVDSAGATEGVDVVVETVAIKGGAFESEYARVVCRDIPQDDADDVDKLRWWISQTPELGSIVDEYGEQAVTDLLKVAQSDNAETAVKKHTVKIVDDGVERPAPVNPHVSPLQVPAVEQTLEAHDYPRMIIEGNLPEWAGKRYRSVRATATIGVLVSELESVADTGLKARLSEVFNLPKSYDNGAYMAANFTGEVMGTNAVTKNYKRLMSFDLNEPVPQGIAQQLFDQFNQRRFSGSVTLKGEEIDTTTGLGMGLNFIGGQTVWATMKEAIQSVSYDVAAGEVVVSFGVPQQLGANDLIERLRAARKNEYSHNFQSDKDVKEGVGGVAATPMSKFNRVGGGGGGKSAPHPWQVTIKKSDESGEYKAQVNVDSVVFKSLTNTDKYELNLSESVTVTGADYLVLEYDASKAGMNDALSVKAVPKDGYEAIVTETTDGATTHLFSRVVLASFETSDGDANGAANDTTNETPIGVLKIKDQVARNHLYQTFICTFGGRFLYFKSL